MARGGGPRRGRFKQAFDGRQHAGGRQIRQRRRRPAAAGFVASGGVYIRSTLYAAVLREDILAKHLLPVPLLGDELLP